jgi:micrococcal nuclease|tara:strand:+ start:3428 stop:3793 length:366 start_codon:yes stop_codon:yes gene_type:complete
LSTPYYYNCKLDRVIDGDTIDVDIDLGFNVVLVKQRVRLAGIDTPESRTRNLTEKALGLKAKERLIELCGAELQLKSLGKDKYGRILGVPHTTDAEDICKILIKEGHAVEYWGGTKTKVWG